MESAYDVSLWPFKQFRQSDYDEDYEAVSALNEEPEAGSLYWINSTSNTRHNSGCRYYGKTKNGYFTNEKTGDACGICGG